MEWILVCVSVTLAVEVFLRTSFKRNVSDLLHFMTRSTKTITSSKISDHWKEKVLVNYSVKIFKNSFQFFFCLLATFIPILLAHFVGILFHIDLFEMLMTPGGLIVSIAFGSIYIVLRHKVFHE